MLFVMMVLAGGFGARAAEEKGGPTPYPDAKDEKAWPGVGPIRVGGWMTGERKAFWARRAQDKGAVVFVGDSLIGGWKIEPLAKAFPGLKTANRGIGGDVSRGVLFRLEEDVLDLSPTAIVMCVGSNDLSTQCDPALTEKNLAAILAKIRAYDANLPVVMCLIPPRDVKDAPVKPGAQADLNARIAKLAATDKRVAVVDSFKLLATADGKPTPEFFAKDKIHLVPAGFEKWAVAIRAALESLGVK
jgi:lysophospholipase L1-like esterase